MPEIGTQIGDLFSVPDRFLRSVQLERDFLDVAALDDYILTPPMAEAFSRIADGLRVKSTRRAWRVTGDYGVGKSSFALVLAHLVGDQSARSAARIAGLLGWTSRSRTVPPMWPILLTGTREPMVPALARGIANGINQKKRSRGRPSTALARLATLASEVESSGSVAELHRLIEAVRDHAASEGAGVLLIVDELGKFLEHAALSADREDVFLLQQLAETAARSAERPFLLLGLLHQGFQSYAERLPSNARHEWDKIAGRFDEIVFDQPLTHTAALVSGALNTDPRRLPIPVRDAARKAATATAAMGWLGGGTTGAAGLDAARLYPLHPTLVPVLVRFFARFGQHERSLFGFLLSSEPFGLQAFAARPIAPTTWYGLPEFYDYVRAVFGHRLAGASYRNQWLRIVTTVDSAVETDAAGLRLLKAVAILNLLDAEDLLATARAMEAAFAPQSAAKTLSSLADVTAKGLLFQRGAAGSLRLWPNSSVGLEVAFEAAARVVGEVESVATGLDRYVDHEPIMARRHYLESGTLRYFELRYAPVADMAMTLSKATEADGLVVVALADTELERTAAIASAASKPFAERPDVIVGVVQPLLGLAPELQDLRCWEWVSSNTPDLIEDTYAAAEVARQLSATRRMLEDRLADYLGLRSSSPSSVRWFRAGVEVIAPSRGGISALLSDACNELFNSAPLITNELLNRNMLSSAAAAARMRLIEHLFNSGDKPLVGIDPSKSPPEKSMYLSVLKLGNVHVPEGDRYTIAKPVAKADPLRLRPALNKVMELVDGARGDRVPVTVLLDALKARPLGVRSGVAPLLLAITLRAHSHELAAYENGTFLHRFGPSDFLRLMKAPTTFEIQHCRVAGVRLDVFNELAAAFASAVPGRRPDLLDVVRPLCQFAAQLPEYTRRSSGLSRVALAVRDVLLSAREPGSMLFRDLPEACGIGAFPSERPSDPERVRLFVAELHDAVGELRAAYPELLDRLVNRVAEAVGDQRSSFDRVRLASRASRVILVARDPRLRTFALRLRDPGLSDDGWAEALASFIIAKPPARWAPGDESRFGEEVGALSELFHKVEVAAFQGETGPPSVDAIRLNLTRADGQDLARVVDPRAEDSELVAAGAKSASRWLPQDRNLRLQLLTRLLWSELQAEPADVNHEVPAEQPRLQKRTK